MSILHRAVRILVLVALAMSAVLVMTASFAPGDWGEATDFLGVRNGLVFVLGLAMFFLAALFLLTGIPRKRRTRFLTIENENGRVSISTDAIAEYVGKLVEEFPGVIKMRPRVVPAKNAVDIVVAVRVKAGPQIHEICQLLQTRIRESMTDGLGISEVRRVEVTVSGIVAQRGEV